MSTPATDDQQRRSRLQAMRLGTLVRDHLGRAPSGAPEPFMLGATLLDDDVAWILLAESPERGLGPALTWAHRQGASRVHVLADRATGLLARRATAFGWPVEVWHVEDRQLLPAVAEPLASPPPAAPEHLALIPTIEAGGAHPVVEHGVVIGEVRGLEVCRVTDDPVSGAVRLEVGVGAHDREAFAIMHGEVPTVDALAGVVAAVSEHRRVDTVQHPLQRLVPERLLRWRLEQEPELIGLRGLAAVEPPVPRPNVSDRMPCSAIGRTVEGRAVAVVCSVGVDLDLIPYATDARLAASREVGVGDGEVDTLVVTPARDAVPVTAELNERLAHSLSLVAVPS